MSIFSDEKYGATKICEQCFGRFDVSNRWCPHCRIRSSFDSVSEVGHAKARYGIYCFVFAALALVALAAYAVNAGLTKMLGSPLSILLSFFATAVLSKGAVFYIFGRRIIKKNMLDEQENKIFFALEMVGLGLSALGAFIWGYYLFHQDK